MSPEEPKPRSAAERVIFEAGEADTNGLGTLIGKTLIQALAEPEKRALLPGLETSFGFQDTHKAERATTVTVKDSRVLIQNGIQGQPEFMLLTDLPTLLTILQCQPTWDGFKTLLSADGRAMVRQFLNGKSKLIGVFKQPKKFRRFRKLLSE